MADDQLDATVWLARIAPKFHALTNSEKKAVADFCLLWGLFEGRCLEGTGNVHRITQFARSMEPALEQDASFLNGPLTYFQQRYVEPRGGFTYHFEQLYFRDKDNRPHVADVLHGLRSDNVEVLIGLLIIVYRFRNNLFHGLKWQYELRGQFDNFSTANELLMQVMNRSLCWAD